MASGDVPGQPAVDHNLIDFDTEYVSYSYTRQNTRIPSVGFRLFFVLPREVILRVIWLFPFLKPTIRFETTVHFQTGS